MKPELLAPAGNLEKLKYAAAYGADAVYFGMKFGSLRSFAENFTLEDAAQGLDHLHQNGKKGYVTLNIYPFSDEYPQVIETAKQLDDAGADALIVADIGVFHELKKLGLKARIHISTQANTLSLQAALAYAQMGASRVNLARELSAEQIETIQKGVNGLIETEVFVHGSVCFSYSGRCAISDYMTGFRANRGECKHPCRWNYSVVEEKRPGQYFPVFEDQRGLYLFNSKELALFEYVPRLAKAGVASLKIEGRNKSIHYIASVVSLYRQIIDGTGISPDRAIELLSRIPNRGYSQGFMKGALTTEDYKFERSISHANSIFVANVTQSNDGGCVLEVRNKINGGDSLEMLSPNGSISEIIMPQSLQLTTGDQANFANNSQFIKLDTQLPVRAILRRVGQVDELEE